VIAPWTERHRRRAVRTDRIAHGIGTVAGSAQPAEALVRRAGSRFVRANPSCPLAGSSQVLATPPSGTVDLLRATGDARRFITARAGLPGPRGVEPRKRRATAHEEATPDGRLAPHGYVDLDSVPSGAQRVRRRGCVAAPAGLIGVRNGVEHTRGALAARAPRNRVAP
jgi:hypothetical protein